MGLVVMIFGYLQLVEGIVKDHDFLNVLLGMP